MKNLDWGNVSAITVLLMNHSSSKCNKPRNYHINISYNFHIYHIRLFFPLQYVPVEIILRLMSCKVINISWLLSIKVIEIRDSYESFNCLCKWYRMKYTCFLIKLWTNEKFSGHTVDELIIMRIEGTFFIFHSNRSNL